MTGFLSLFFSGVNTTHSPSEMVAHEVGILREVNRLQSQAPKPLAAVDGLMLSQKGREEA